MANKDASSVDEGAARDYDDRLSDDSSGELSQKQLAWLHITEQGLAIPTQVMLSKACQCMMSPSGCLAREA